VLFSLVILHVNLSTFDELHYQPYRNVY